MSLIWFVIAGSIITVILCFIAYVFKYKELTIKSETKLTLEDIKAFAIANITNMLVEALLGGIFGGIGGAICDEIRNYNNKNNSQISTELPDDSTDEDTKIQDSDIEFIEITEKDIETEVKVRNLSYVDASGHRDFHDSVEADMNDKFEFRLYYKNLSETSVENVQCAIVLSENMILLSSPKLYTTKTTKGTYVDELVTEGWASIGDYAAGERAYLCFDAKVINNNLHEGSNNLFVWCQISIGSVKVQGHATVVVKMSNGQVEDIIYEGAGR